MVPGLLAEHQACGVQLIGVFKALCRGLLRGALPSANKTEASSPGLSPVPLEAAVVHRAEVVRGRFPV